MGGGWGYIPEPTQLSSYGGQTGRYIRRGGCSSHGQGGTRWICPLPTLAARATRAEVTSTGTDDSTEAKEGTRVRTGTKDTLQTPPIPETDSGSSAETRRIVVKVGRDDSREGNGNSVVNKGKDIRPRQYSERLGDRSCYALFMRLGNETSYTIL